MQRWLPYLNTAVGTSQRYSVGSCDNCSLSTLWDGELLVYPDTSLAPPANEDLDPEERALYDEAGSVLGRSPRASAALLRLSCERLCRRISGRDGTLNELIGELVKEGKLTPDLQKALDAVRISGNNLVHPGQIDSADHGEVATALFGLINVVAERLLTEPRRIADLYASLPEGARQAVERRDSPRC
jgi:Domain of unknown function (DUF4145)